MILRIFQLILLKIQQKGSVYHAICIENSMKMLVLKQITGQMMIILINRVKKQQINLKKAYTRNQIERNNRDITLIKRGAEKLLVPHVYGFLSNLRNNLRNKQEQRSRKALVLKEKLKIGIERVGLASGCGVSHLTSAGSGYLSECYAHGQRVFSVAPKRKNGYLSTDKGFDGAFEERI